MRVTDAATLARTEHTRPQEGSPVRGILVGLALSAAFWGGLALLLF